MNKVHTAAAQSLCRPAGLERLGTDGGIRSRLPTMLSSALPLIFAFISHIVWATPSGIEDPAYATEAKQLSATGDYSYTATGLVVGPDGNTWLTGTSRRMLGTLELIRPLISKLDSHGLYDRNFGVQGILPLAPFDNSVNTHAIAPMADGKVIVAVGRSNGLSVQRRDPQGNIDTAFGTQGETAFTQASPIAVSKVLVQPDGKIVVLGLMYPTALRATSLFLYRLLPDGSKDVSFGTGGVTTVQSTTTIFGKAADVILHADGNYWVGCEESRTPVGSFMPTYIRAKVSNSGAAVGANGTQVPLTGIQVLKMDADGGGWLLGPDRDAPHQFALVRLVTPGSRDPNFGTYGVTIGSVAPYTVGQDVVQGADGRIYVVGTQDTSPTATPARRGFVMCFQPDSQPDLTFNNGQSFVTTTTTFGAGLSKVILQQDGNLLVTGASGAVSAGATPPPSYGVTRYLTGDPAQYTAPEIVTAPVDQTVEQTMPVSFTVVAAPNVLKPWYRWRKGNTIMHEFTGPTMAFSAHYLREGSYTVEVINKAGASSISAPFRLTVHAPPLMLDQPFPEIHDDGTVTIHAQVVGRPPITYQWQRYGSNYGDPVVNTNGYIPVELPAGPGYGGEYRVVVTNAEGSTASETVTYTPRPDYPIVTRQPSSDEALNPPYHTLNVQVSGVHPFTFQWQKDGVNIGSPISTGIVGGPRFASNNLVINGTAAGSGTYRCIIANVHGWCVSAEAVIKYYDKAMLRQSTPLTILNKGDYLSLAVFLLTNDNVLSYYWLRNGRKVVSTVNVGDYSNYSVEEAAFADAGNYQLVLNTSKGRLISDVAQVAVVDPAPQHLVVGPNATATLTTRATGPNLYYTWRRVDGQPLAGPRYSGLHTPTLKITACTTADAAAYVCDVTWAAYYGETRPSGITTLEVAALAPVVQTTSLPSGTAALYYTHTLTALNAAAKFTASGLPRGLALNAATGVISGLPGVIGTFAVKISASNPLGTSPTVILPLTVGALPAPVRGPLLGVIKGPGAWGVETHYGVMDAIVSPTGTFTGKLSFSAKPGAASIIPLSGQLKGNPEGHEIVGVSNTFTLPTTSYGVEIRGKYRIVLLWVCQDGLATLAGGYLVNQEEISILDIALYKPAWNALTKPATAAAGYSTVSLSPTSLTADQCGTGYGTVKTELSGAFTVSGKLPDGTAYTSARFLVDEGPDALNNGGFVHAWLYGNRGSITGWISGMSVEPFSGVVGSVSWTRPSIVSPRDDINDWVPNALYYSMYDIPMAIQGASYVPPPAPGGSAGQVSLYMLNASAGDNIAITVWSEVDEAPFATSGTLSLSHVLTPDPNVHGHELTLGPVTFNPATGVFSGPASYRVYNAAGALAATVPATVSGCAVRQTPSSYIGTGVGFILYTATRTFNTPAPTRLTLPESGTVRLEVPLP